MTMEDSKIPTSPRGNPIVATAERLTAKAYITFNENGSWHHNGETDVEWESQETEYEYDEPLWVDSEGFRWRPSQIDWKGIDPTNRELS